MPSRRNSNSKFKGFGDEPKSTKPLYVVLGKPFKYDSGVSTEANVRRALRNDVGVLVINDEVETDD